VETILECGAKVQLVSPELTPFLEEAVRRERVRRVATQFSPFQLEGMFLIRG
jgi:hypothetical protein